MSMHEIDLSRGDLNLLVVFEALMQERHVGRAAVRLSLSQSATSHALGRLRDMFGDPLFVRHPKGIEPTNRARELAQPLADVLAHLRQLIGQAAPSDPATWRRTFTVAAHDYALAVLMPPLVGRLRTQAPGVELRCISLPPQQVVEAIDRGALDFAVGGFIGVSAARIARTLLFTDRFVGVARKDHPHLQEGRMSFEAFLDLPHVLVSADGSTRGDIDRSLLALGAERRIAMTVPSFLALPLIVEASGLIGVLPEQLARRAMKTTAMAVFELPFDAEPVTCSMLASAALMPHPEMQWMQQQLTLAAAESVA